MKISSSDENIIAQFTKTGQTRFETAIDGWQRDYQAAEIRGYTHIDATLNPDGTYLVRYWDRDWDDNPQEFVVISQKTLTKKDFLKDIQMRNEFIDRTLERYERQKHINSVLLELFSQ